MNMGLITMSLLVFTGSYIGLFGGLSKTTSLTWIGSSMIVISVIVGIGYYLV